MLKINHTVNVQLVIVDLTAECKTLAHAPRAKMAVLAFHLRHPSVTSVNVQQTISELIAVYVNNQLFKFNSKKGHLFIFSKLIIKVNPCITNPCLNGGNCVVSNNQATCSCRQGYSGNLCQITDRCLTNPCLNGGTCVPANNANGYICQCLNNYFGNICETRKYSSY
jgi:hypothetical protein